ncbi:MAG: carbon-nitrogen hydrolase family protein [Planctomycetota bacterium]|jgi:predicted amidohydrolase
MQLRIATSYLPISADIDANLAHIRRQMRQAAEKRCDVIHFPECALSGYAGVDFESYDGFDWSRLEEAAREVLAEARQLRLWTLLGSTHRLSRRNKPHNSVYVIDPRGRVVDRYDKLFCAGPKSGRAGDLRHYTPGSEFCEFRIHRIRCGILICHDCRYPELYREYKRRKVRVMFHSFHAGNVPPDRWKAIAAHIGPRRVRLNGAATIPGIVFPATMQSMAANNFMWISCSNSSKAQSCFPGFFVRPDGVMTGRLRRNTAGILVSTVDTEEELYDSTAPWRDRAMDGVLHSGETVRDSRSGNRTST